MDKITLERIDRMHPAVKDDLKRDYLYCNNKILGRGVRLRFAQTLRTFEEQDELYAQGRTKAGPIVTNAKGGQSYHNYGLAFDIVLMIDKNLDGNFEEVSWDRIKDSDKDGIADWEEVTKFFERKGWENGARFGDAPHFQKNFGINWRDLLRRYKAKDFIDGVFVRLKSSNAVNHSIEEIAKIIAAKAGFPNSYKKVESSLKRGLPLPFKLKD